MSTDNGLPAAEHKAPSAQSVTVRYLTPEQCAALITAARKHARYAQRDACMVLLAYQHGLRVSELCALRPSDVDYKAATLRIVRRKSGDSGVHPLTGEALRALRALKLEGSEAALFTNERGAPLSPAGVRATLRRLGKLAGLPRSNPHALRHACGYKLVNQGTDLRLVQAYLGHRDIRSTVRYTAVNAKRFRGLF